MTRHRNSTLCTSFRNLARWTAGKIRSSNRHRLAFNEETITESVLLKLSESHRSPHFKIKSWSKQDEGIGTKATGGKPTGADWDFFFADGTGAGVAVRIQAKRQYRSGSYGGLDGSGLQIKDLINNCGAALPIYVFYNDPTWKWPFQDWLCDLNCNPRFWGSSVWGCSFAAATAIPPKNKPKPSEIAGMRPWHCLVCPCPSNATSAASLPQRVVGAIKAAYGRVDIQSSGRFRDVPAMKFEVTDDVPRWARLLMTEETRADGLDAPDRIGAELNEYLIENGLSGVALIQQLSDLEHE